MSDSPIRVVITGMGVVSPIGCEIDNFWNSLTAGVSGISKLNCLPDDPSLPVQYGGEVKSFQGNIEDFGPLDKQLQRNIRKWQKVMCREIELGVAACQKALHHSGLTESQRDPERTGIVYGCDYILSRPEEFADGVEACLDANGEYHLNRWPLYGMDKLNPLWLLKYLPNMPASHVAIYNDLRGPSNSLTVREASNNLSIGEAVSVIQRGAADAMIVGSTGSAIQPVRSLYIAGQAQMAPHDPEDPTAMSRPFDNDRQGMVLGEGAGALVLESLKSAQARGATIWGEVVATSASAVGARAGRDHLRMATFNMLADLKNRSPQDFAERFHIQACGRGEVATDISESLGIQDVFGNLSHRIPVVASKSYFGNLGSGGAAVEVVAGCLGLYHDRLFRTLNHHTPDPRCPITIAQDGEPAGNAFVHLSYTREGQSAAILVRRYS